MGTSVIIRVKNERENLSEVLHILKQQTYQDFEVVVVNDNSTDGSEKISFNYFPKDRIQIVNVPKNMFTYAHASNIGAKAAKGKYLVFLSAHSFPFTNTWLEDGIKNFINETVAGVFAYPISGPKGTLAERIFFDLEPMYFRGGKKWKAYNSFSFGLLGTTNAIIRKDLWEKHHFDIRLKLGGEDVEWAIYWIKKSYVIIHDPKFRVYHSHSRSLIGVWKQKRSWDQMIKDVKQII